MPQPLPDTPTLLTSRFNAHLTFNVLNTVQGFLLEKDAEGAFELVSCYSRLLHKMLINGRLDIPLKEEIETIQDYLQIERMRADGGFSFSVETDPLLNNLIFPKSLMVSFVENAIKHGIRKLNGIGWIQVSAKSTSNPDAGEGKTSIISIRNLAPAKINGYAHDHQTVHGHELAYGLLEAYMDRTGQEITIEVREYPAEGGLLEVEVEITIKN
ncbi:MAG: hypothetical protein A2X22_14020 [Bacteroidetes bacterium GWF2_49_14]|nr:MAG: hypothetical protein A2X22_14020 [Bacteroidetes bacterium GWF2_49_14]HBB90870.1 hypothetical protein [Bacteroidales bacterium]